MKVTILNGNPEPTGFDGYLEQVKAALTAGGHQVNEVRLRERDVRFCIGCWGCWVKKPGECVVADESGIHRRAFINADFVLFASPLKMGFPTSLLKRALDKSIPLIHPYAVVDRSEAHHRKRYDRYPRLGLLLERESGTDARDLAIVTEIFSRAALNMKSALEFSLTTQTPAAEAAGRIAEKKAKGLAYSKDLLPIPGTPILPPGSITLLNGSPRGSRGNTPLMLGQFATGFTSVAGNQSETHHLIHLKSTAKFVEAFANAECVWMGFPLYVDAMPGSVKAFIEALEPLKGRKENPPLGFLVQSGFPEGVHSRYVERYLEKLAARLGSPYLGTIVKGGGEGVRQMPPAANEALFTNLMALGRGFAEHGTLDPEILKKISHPERFPAILGPVFSLLLRLPMANGYWDPELKKNGVFEQRFARPYLEE